MSLARLLYRADYRRQIRHLPMRYLFGCGTLFVSYMLLLFLAIGAAQDRQQVLEVGLLNYLWPVLTLLLTAVMLKQIPSGQAVAGNGSGLGGHVSGADPRVAFFLASRSHACAVESGRLCDGAGGCRLLGGLLRADSPVGRRPRDRCD